MTALFSFIALIGAFTTWLWKTHERTTTLGLQQATTDAKVEKYEERTAAELAEIKTEQREMRDSHVRMDTQLGAVLSQLGKLDRIEKIDSRTEVTQAMVERIDKQVIPREALEARFKAIEDRLP